MESFPCNVEYFLDEVGLLKGGGLVMEQNILSPLSGRIL